MAKGLQSAIQPSSVGPLHTVPLTHHHLSHPLKVRGVSEALNSPTHSLLQYTLHILKCSETSTTHTPVYIGGHLLPPQHPHSYVCHQYVLCSSCVHCLKFCNICVYSSILIKNTKINLVCCTTAFKVHFSSIPAFKLLKHTTLAAQTSEVVPITNILILLVSSA